MPSALVDLVDFEVTRLWIFGNAFPVCRAIKEMKSKNAESAATMPSAAGRIRQSAIHLEAGGRLICTPSLNQQLLVSLVWFNSDVLSPSKV